MKKLNALIPLLLMSVALQATDATPEKPVGAGAQSLAGQMSLTADASQHTDEQRLKAMHQAMLDARAEFIEKITPQATASLEKLRTLYKQMESFQTAATTSNALKVQATLDKLVLQSLQVVIGGCKIIHMSGEPEYSPAIVEGLTSADDMDQALIVAKTLLKHKKENGRPAYNIEKEAYKEMAASTLKSLHTCIAQYYPESENDVVRAHVQLGLLAMDYSDKGDAARKQIETLYGPKSSEQPAIAAPQPAAESKSDKS